MRGVAIGLAAALLGAGGPAGAAAASLRTSRGCYLLGRPVQFSGSGFSPRRTYDVAVDGVDFGQASTDAGGSLRNHLSPGGLPAGAAQSVEWLDVSDGSLEASTSFTVTRAAGARLEASRGDPRTLRAPFQVWGFSLDGSTRRVFLHYVAPSGAVRSTVFLGRTGGQCGYLRTRGLRTFPFSPSPGTWVLQLDTHRVYSPHAGGASARIRVAIT